MSNKFYITTAIDYVNASPHIGHALEKVQADVLARYRRLLDEDVFFLTGTDEHGAKIAGAAEAAGVPVRKFVNANVKKFKELARALNISNDYFIRTTDKKIHWPGAVKMWRELEKSGDIYKKQYRGLYCIGHEAFVTKKDLKDGKCILHKKEPEVVNEENYFFRLSKYTEKITEQIKSGSFRVVPDSARNEILKLLAKGLEDVSFSRPSKDLSWGIPVSGDEEHTMYVWGDALTNYLSAIGYGQLSVEGRRQFNKYWPADIQAIGRDILRFHAAIWPGMLLSAGLPLPKTLFVHGFISVGGEKMSKSLGNVVDPFALINKYGTDAVRYFLLREIPPTKDGDFTYEKFEERYRADLARGIGNFTARVINLGARHVREAFEARESAKTQKRVKKTWEQYNKAMEQFRFDESLQAVWGLISYGDKFVASHKVWNLPEKDSKKFVLYIAELCAILAEISSMLRPFLPETSEKIFKQLGLDPDSKKEWQFKLKRGKPLFPMV